MSKEDFIKGGKPERIATGTAMSVPADRFFANELAYGQVQGLQNSAKVMGLDLASGNSQNIDGNFAQRVVEAAEKEITNNQISLGLANNRGRE